MKKKLGPKISAHQVDLDAYTYEDGRYTPWVAKLNKHGGSKGVDASVLEVAFSEIAYLFVKPGLTPPARLLVDGEGSRQKVVGLASEKFSAQILKQMDQGEVFFAFNPSDWSYKRISRAVQEADLAKEGEQFPEHKELLNKKLEAKAVQSGVHFLNKMPSNFMSDLIKRHQSGELILDMESLASIFTASYVLEEDDLHKGNIGFYVHLTPEGKKKFTFFKIDHDMMFVDSIMSSKETRILSAYYDKDSFKISLRDLEGFPDLKDSGNHYWPTKWRLSANRNIGYTNKKERDAFSSLKKDKDFKKAKWKYFLKAAVLPIELVQKSVASHLDPVRDIDKLYMIQTAVSVRLGLLREQMSQSPAFKQYMNTEGKAALEEIKQEMEGFLATTSLSEREKGLLLLQVDEHFANLLEYVNASCYSPIQKSILHGSYRFKQKPDKKNPVSEKEVDTAYALFIQHKEKNAAQAFQYACMTLDLVQQLPGEAGRAFTLELSTLQEFKRGYLQPKPISTLQEFKEAVVRIEQSGLPLKQQKKEILLLLKDSKLSVQDLKNLRKQVQKTKPDAPELRCIHQLRSALWFIRMIRGTYGKTKTSSLMIEEIDKQIKTACSKQQAHYKSRFPKQNAPEENKEESKRRFFH